jgi:hypothetical protein
MCEEERLKWHVNPPMKPVGAVEFSWSIERNCLRRTIARVRLSSAKRRKQSKLASHQDTDTPSPVSLWDVQACLINEPVQAMTAWSTAAARETMARLS